jgi:hypothetical protein
VADLAGPGAGIRTRLAHLTTARGDSKPFAWAVIGVDAVAAPAAAAGLVVARVDEYYGRWCAVLVRR